MLEKTGEIEPARQGQIEQATVSWTIDMFSFYPNLLTCSQLRVVVSL